MMKTGWVNLPIRPASGPAFMSIKRFPSASRLPSLMFSSKYRSTKFSVMFYGAPHKFLILLITTDLGMTLPIKYLSKGNWEIRGTIDTDRDSNRLPLESTKQAQSTLLLAGQSRLKLSCVGHKSFV